MHHAPDPARSPIIRVRQLFKAYGKSPVLHGIDLDVYPGQIIGYIGPNGAGKSTTVRILAGLDRDFSGQVEVCGYDVSRDPLAVKRCIGFVPEQAELYDVLTPMEFLRLVGSLHDMPPAQIEERAGRMLHFFGLQERRDDRMDGFSKGMRQKVLLISGLLHDPQLLFLDEPLAERQSFRWVYAMMARSREFKVRVYPSFGIIPVMFLYFVLLRDDRSLEALAGSQLQLGLIYITAYMMIMPLSQARFSDRYRAAWLFRAHPLASTGPVRYGQLMATLAQFFLPVFAVLSVVLLAIWGLSALGDIVISFGVLVLMAVTYLLFEKDLPFSEEYKRNQAGNNIGTVFLLMFIIGGLGGLHYLATRAWWLLAPFAVVVYSLAFMALRGVREEERETR